MDTNDKHASGDHVCADNCTIGGIIYVGGASDYQGGTVVDTTNFVQLRPWLNTIGDDPGDTEGYR